jgi:XTP/dITP diphosphohydrolase
MLKLLLATNNPGKLVEMQTLLGDLALELVTPEQIGVNLNVKEDGSTYSQNAALKAQAFAAVSDLLTIGDDSGLEVNALNGAPGLYSARFSPVPGATDADRRAYLLTKLNGKPEPWYARFRCAIAIANPQGSLFFTEGICEGVIISQERGLNGFGYDPIFLLPEFGQTMAQLGLPEKNKVSHRARAIQAARPYLSERLNKHP